MHYQIFMIKMKDISEENGPGIGQRYSGPSCCLSGPAGPTHFCLQN